MRAARLVGPAWLSVGVAWADLAQARSGQALRALIPGRALLAGLPAAADWRGIILRPGSAGRRVMAAAFLPSEDEGELRAEGLLDTTETARFVTAFMPNSTRCGWRGCWIQLRQQDLL